MRAMAAESISASQPSALISCLLLLLVLASWHPQSTSADPHCDKAFFWYPDGSSAPGNADWSSRFFAKGPCLKIAGIGMTETYLKTVIVVDRSDYTNTYMPIAGIADSLAFSEEVNLNPGPGGVPQWRQRALNVLTNTFCSSGAHIKGGRFLSIGGDNSQGGYVAGKGAFSMRSFTPCLDGTCDYQLDGMMAAHRWYPTAQLLADGRVVVVGGSLTGVAINTAEANVPSLEYYPRAAGEGAIDLPFLTDTLPYNLYPFVHLLPNGQVFIFAGTQYILWDSEKNAVAPGETPQLKAYDAAGNLIVRSYPLAASSAMLPLSPRRRYEAEIMICGGSSSSADPGPGKANAFAWGDDKCWRISPLAAAPAWTPEKMRFKRVMPMAVLLPDGGVLIIGGTGTGFEGIPNGAHNATLTPELYNSATHTWYPGDLGVSKVPRAYHSSAVVLHDGTIFVSGSNPHQDGIQVYGLDYPTEFRTEFYFPPYFRIPGPPPTILQAPRELAIGGKFHASFRATPGAKSVSFVLVQPGFSTHAGNHGMRNVELQVLGLRAQGPLYSAFVAAPPSLNICPPTWYWLFVVVDGKPNRDGHYTFVN